MELQLNLFDFVKQKIKRLPKVEKPQHFEENTAFEQLNLFTEAVRQLLPKVFNCLKEAAMESGKKLYAFGAKKLHNACLKLYLGLFKTPEVKKRKPPVKDSLPKHQYYSLPDSWFADLNF